MGGWVGGWVGGWLNERELLSLFPCAEKGRGWNELLDTVGGWVGGWVPTFAAGAARAADAVDVADG